MEFIINRFEGDFAVCESPGGKLFQVPADVFTQAKEGDVIRLSIDKEKTAARKKASKARLKALFNENKQKGQKS